MQNLLSSVDVPYILLRDLNDTDRKIFIASGTSLPGSVKAYYNSSTKRVQVDHASSSYANDMATAVAAYINGELSAYFSAATVSGSARYDDSTSACAVEITYVTKSDEPNGESKKTPAYVKRGRNSGQFNSPEITKFSGGATSEKKSAGDKVQDIYGIINNSTTKAGRAVTTGLLVGAAALAVVGTAGLAAAPIAASAGIGGSAVLMGANAARQGETKQDYICGIQIPYNSMIKSTDGEQYVARNFFMPTGRIFTRGGKEKGSEKNDQPASVTFSHDASEKTGIQGAVQKMDITYDAGETIYNFNLIFAPIDNLL
jgi:hypothetical protein